MSYTDYLQRWRDAGLIDESTAEAIRAFETREEKDERAGSDRPSLTEAVLYLGFVVVAVGLVVLVGSNWEEMESWARLLTLGGPAVLALGLGFALRTTGESHFVRGGHVAWLLGVGLVFFFILVAFHEGDADDDMRGGFLAAALLAFAVALALWAISGSTLQLLAIAGTTVLFAHALGNWPDDFSVAIAGTAALIGGAVGIALTEMRVFVPRLAAAPVFALVAASGAYEAGMDGSLPWAEVLAFVAAGALMAVGLLRSSFAYLAIGVGLAFLALVTLMFEYFESDLGASVALIVSGALLVAAVLALIPLRRVVAARQHG